MKWVVVAYLDPLLSNLSFGIQVMADPVTIKDSKKETFKKKRENL